MQHEILIRRTFELAKKGSGQVSPNPLVGAVIVRNGEIISEGYHARFGDLHAEVSAIRKSGLDTFEDCTIYVNLEPCSHYGKTPPCTDLLIEKKFSRVVCAVEDPNPMVSGSGIAKLRDAGIEVISGICENEARFLNRYFFVNQTEKRAYSVLKVAQSIDGCIALQNGESKWITGEESRKYTHLLRSHIDAVMVGKRTVMKDNPELNTRLVNGRNPLRIALDTNLTLPLDLKILKNEDRVNTIVVCSVNSATSRKADILRLAGVRVISAIIDDNGRLDIYDVLVKLYNQYSIGSVLVEGGSMVHSYMAKNDIIDEINVFIAPIIMGNCKKSFFDINLNSIADAKRFKIKEINTFGEDVHILMIKELV